MAKNRISKASKRRLFLLGPISFLLIGYFAYCTITYTYSIIKLEHTKKELEQKLVALKEEEQLLQVEVVRLQDPEYIARYARENYLYSKDGEYIIKLEKNKTDSTESSDREDYIPYYTFGVAGAVLLVGYVIYKVRKKENK